MGSNFLLIGDAQFVKYLIEMIGKWWSQCSISSTVTLQQPIGYYVEPVGKGFCWAQCECSNWRSKIKNGGGWQKKREKTKTTNRLKGTSIHFKKETWKPI